MKKILFFLLCLAVYSCQKSPVTPVEPQNIDFNWTTISTKTVDISENSNIFSENGDTVALNLVPGKYEINVGVNSQLVIVPTTKDNDIESIISFPSIGKYATVMAEDVYPYFGDYDFNDVVFGMRIDFVMEEGTSNVKTIKFNILPAGAGSGLEKIGIAAYFAGQSITKSKAVTGKPANTESLFADVDSDGFEACDGGVVVPLTGNYRQHFMKKDPNNKWVSIDTARGLVNTSNINEYWKGKVFTVNVNIKPIPYGSIALFGTDVDKTIVDLFIVVSDRGREIHLRGQQATSRYYIGDSDVKDFEQNGYVWMMMTDTPIPYPAEYVSIETAYPNFTKWVNSKGATDTDWYKFPAKVFSQKNIEENENGEKIDKNYLYQYMAN